MSAQGSPDAPTPEPTSPGAPTTTEGVPSHLPEVKRQRSRGPLVAAIVVVIIVLVIAGVGYQQHWFSPASNEGSTCASGLTLQGDGAQFVAPLMDAWIYTFGGSTGASIDFPASGSGTAVTHFSESPPLIDFAVADEPLNATERASMPATPLTLPIVGGALTIIYNVPGVTGHLNLTGAVLAGIYDGTIKNWNSSSIAALNPGVALPSLTITTVHRSDPAGTTYVLTDFLSASSGYWSQNIGKGLTVSWPTNATQTAQDGNSKVLSTVATLSGAIGYTDLTDTLTYKTPLQYAAVENPSGHFIVPTVNSTASAINDLVAANPNLPDSAGNWYNVSMINAPGATDYPLATFVYLYIYQNLNELTPLPSGAAATAAKAGLMVYWIEWILSTGQTMTNETKPTQLYYAALPASIIAIDEAGLKTVTFNGAAVSACT